VDRADGRLQQVLACLPPVQGSGDQLQTLGDLRAVPPGACPLGQGGELALSAGASWARCVGGQHELEEAGQLGVSGSAARTDRASRMASPERTARARSGPKLPAQPSLNSRYSTWITDRTRPASPSGGGSVNASSDALTFAFARLIRWAMVASGTRNAAAISRVVRPPTARKVSGMAAAGVSDGVAAHEHEDRRVVVAGRRVRRDERPRCGQVLATASGGDAPVLVSHAAGGHADQPREGLVGRPLGGPPGGGEQRLLRGVLGAGEVVIAADEHGEDLRRQLAQQVLGARRRGHTSGSGALSTSRASIGWRIGAPFYPGAADAWAAISTARSILSTSTSR